MREAIQESLGTDERASVEDALSYPEGSAGCLMEREWAAVRADVSLEVVQRYIFKHGSLPHRTTALMVVDRDGVFLGKLPLEAIKEITISVINGIVWALVVGVIAWLWFGQIDIALTLGAAMVINLLTASISGLVIPLILDRFDIDPALSGSAVLTTVTDVVGFMSFPGMAIIFLL